MALDPARTLRGAAAGAAAAGVWALQQPLDKRAFRSRYDDVELLGRALLPRRAADSWYPLGLALHVQNGAIFGAVYANVAPRTPLPAGARGVIAGLVEHLGAWSIGRLTDRFHPARDELPTLTGSRRAFWQATWRHLLFGVLLGELERRLNPAPPPWPAADDLSAYVSSNGHGNIEHASVGRT